MAHLIDDLLILSRVTRAALRRAHVDLTDLARRILLDLREAAPEREVEARVADELVVNADPGLVRVALENLLENAWKFTSRRPTATIVVGSEARGGETVFFVHDNGAGFDMADAEKIFTPFHRLHSDPQFQGNGIGLATVARAVHRHGGRVWAESRPDQGATFFFTVAAASLTGS